MIAILFGVFAGLSLCAHVVSFVMWWRTRIEMAEMDASVIRGFNDMRWEILDERYRAKREHDSDHA